MQEIVECQASPHAPGCDDGAPPVIYVVYGLVAAGKSTLALKLSEERGAVRFNVDQWYRNLFSEDLTLEMFRRFVTDVELRQWPLIRYRRCDKQIWKVAKQVMGRGKGVVLELSFATVEYRKRFREFFDSSGYPCHLYYVTAERSERLKRFLRFNKNKGKRYGWEPSEAQFDVVDRLIEPATALELRSSTVVDTTSSTV